MNGKGFFFFDPMASSSSEGYAEVKAEDVGVGQSDDCGVARAGLGRRTRWLFARPLIVFQILWWLVKKFGDLLSGVGMEEFSRKPQDDSGSWNTV